jgi:hypothetical protein
MSEHVTEEALRRVMSGETESSAKLALLQHLARCEECAAIGRRVAEGEYQALKSHFAHAETEPLTLPSPARRRVWIYAIAASLAVAAGLSLVLMTIRKPEPRPPLTVRRPAPPVPAPTTQPTTQPPTTTNELDPEWRQLVAHAVETGRLPFPAVLATLRIPGDAPRGPSVDAERVSPAGVVVGEARPRFSWPATDRATYVVLVFDGEREVAQSTPLHANDWTPAKDLPRGRTLAWQVEVRHDGVTGIIPAPSSPPALFRIITESDEREIAQAKTLHGDDPLLLAVLYARGGLRAAALEQLRLAAKRRIAGAGQILGNLDDN